jgi:hypothetical protein
MNVRNENRRMVAPARSPAYKGRSGLYSSSESSTRCRPESFLALAQVDQRDALGRTAKERISLTRVRISTPPVVMSMTSSSG